MTGLEFPVAFFSSFCVEQVLKVATNHEPSAHSLRGPTVEDQNYWQAYKSLAYERSRVAQVCF